MTDPDSTLAAADLTVIINGHREGRLAHHTLRTVHRSIRFAERDGLRIEAIAILDNPDEPTRSVFEEAMGADGYFGPTRRRIIEVAVADAGLARNRGVNEASAPFVAIIDGDNLPTENWFSRGHALAAAHRGPCVVHPEHLIIFQGRSELWPQWASDDSRFRAENFFDRTYWDCFCLASREVFEQRPYLATPRDAGFGPEDWHWYIETVHEGVAHLSAPDTALFYRVKSRGSLQDSHERNRSLIHQAPLLTDPDIARAVLPEAERTGEPVKPRRTRLLKRLLRERRTHKFTDPLPPAPLKPLQQRRARLDRDFVAHDHYRYLYDFPQWSDAEVRAHWRSDGRREGRRRWLTADELEALHPDTFRVDHYRALNGQAMHLSKPAARLHYLSVGRQAGLRARLRRSELKALTKLNLDDYRALHADLTKHEDIELLQHYLEHGLPEGRRTSFTREERAHLEPLEISDVLRAEWRAMHRFEPWVPIPTAATLEACRPIGPPYDGTLTAGSAVWWQLVAALGDRRPDFVFFAPWLRMGGADILLARYARTVAELRPELDVVLITTHGESTHEEMLDDSVDLIDLTQLAGFAELTVDERTRLVATVLTQYRPRAAHIFNAPEGFDALEHYARAMAAHTRLFLSTFVIDYGPEGEIHSHLARRPADYLDEVDKVIVDSHAFVEELHELYRMDRDRFAALHQPVDLPVPRPWTIREEGAALQVLWAARFDRQKRLDILADVAEAAAVAGLEVDWHVYGTPVIASAGEAEDSIARLKALGASFHEPYRSLDELPFDDYDLFLMTSENEGVPNTLLEMMARRLPVMAPLVGGIPEVLDESVGWPIDRFDDIDSYVAALKLVASRRDEAESRADAGLALLAREFSWEAFRGRVQQLEGYLP